MRRLDLVVADDHVVALLVLDALDDVLAVDVLAGGLVDALVTDPIHAALVQPVEIDALPCSGRHQRHRDVYQSETDRAFPDRAWHTLYSFA